MLIKSNLIFLQNKINERKNIMPMNLSLAKQYNKDVISFSARVNLFKRYNIIPEKISLVYEGIKPFDILENTKKLLVEKILEAHELAQKNMNLGNFSKRFYATNMMLKNRIWGLASNVEHSASGIDICGERAAFSVAYNKALQKLSSVNENDLKVKFLAMSNSDYPGTGSVGRPCVECLSWFNTDRFFKKDTCIAVLETNKETKHMELKIRTIADLLPYKGENPSLIDGKDINDLIINKTQKATNFIQAENISDKNILELITQAKNAHDNNVNIDLSGINSSAAVLMSNGKILTGQKFDWTKRWIEEPDIIAVTKFFQGKTFADKPKINAIAYYGKEGIPPLKSLGRISQEIGNENTLVITANGDNIKVRTIRDYMPYLHVSSRLKK